jgi:hypothetical protein
VCRGVALPEIDPFRNETSVPLFVSHRSLVKFALDGRAAGFDRRIYWSVGIGYAGGPFLLSVYLCENCPLSWRLSFGVLTSVFSMVSLGFPWDIAGVHRVFMWPYIVGTAVVVWAAFVIRDFNGQLAPIDSTDETK